MQDSNWKTEYIVSDTDFLYHFGRFVDLEAAKIKRDITRIIFPLFQIAIFERTSLTTWEGRFISKEVTIEK